MADKKTVHIYTDGACSCNPGPGGWAAVLIYGDIKKEISGGEVETTNNRMELTAAIEGIKALKMPCRIELYTDSAYLHDAFSKGWIWSWVKNNWKKSDKKPVLNVDLWQELINLNSIHELHWHKVKGHSDNELNNRCDELARKAIDDIKNDIPCVEDYELYLSVEYFNFIGCYSAYIVHNKNYDKYINSSFDMTQFQICLAALIKSLSTIKCSSIVGIYITDTALYDTIISTQNALDATRKQFSMETARLSELLLAHDVRVHMLEHNERSKLMIKCQEDARNEMTQIISKKAGSLNMQFVKLYIYGAANEKIGSWCSLLICNGKMREYSSSEFSATQNKMRLNGIIETIRNLTEPCIIEINTDSMYLYETATKWMERWESNGWKKANTNDVVHSELWQIISTLSKSHEIYWRRHEKDSSDIYLTRCRDKVKMLLN